MSTCEVKFLITYHTSDKEKSSRIHYIERVVTIDGKPLYSSKIKTEIWHKEDSPLRDFELWLLAQEKSKRSSDIPCDRCNCTNLVRHRWFKGFDFKQKFLNVFCKEFFLSRKTTM